jgi:hypothetical protein
MKKVPVNCLLSWGGEYFWNKIEVNFEKIYSTNLCVSKGDFVILPSGIKAKVTRINCNEYFGKCKKILSAFRYV